MTGTNNENNIPLIEGRTNNDFDSYNNIYLFQYSLDRGKEGLTMILTHIIIFIYFNILLDRGKD
jgi:hypothetical protein